MFPERSQMELYERVNKLEILPTVKLDNDRDIWYKWIEAQDMLLQRNAKPFRVRKYNNPFEVKNEKGITTRYKFKIDLEVKENNEYKEVEEELLNEFSVNETFDKEGNIFLKFDDIYRGLDAVIHKKFSKSIEREKSIGAILKLKPLSSPERIRNFFTAAGYELYCYIKNTERNERTYQKLVIITNDVPLKILRDHLDTQNYEFKDLKGEFKILCDEKEFDAKVKKLLDSGRTLFKGKPKNQILVINSEDDFDLVIYGRILKNIFGKY